MSLPRLYPKKARSARLLGCKRPRDGLQSLPPFWEPCFFCKCRFYAFLLTEEKLLCGITPTLPPKGTAALALKNYRLRSVFYSPLAYHLCAVKRSSLRSERRRSKPLLERSENFQASFLSIIFHMRLTAPALQMTFLRFPLDRGKAFIRHYADSSTQRHNVGASPFNPPQFSKKENHGLVLRTAPPLPKKVTSSLP